MHGYGGISCRHSTVECECENVRLTFVYCFNDVINAPFASYFISQVKSIIVHYSLSFCVWGQVKSLHNFSQYVFIQVSSNNDNTGIEEAAGHVEDD